MTVPIKGGRPRTIPTREELEKRIEEYRKYIIVNQKPWTIERLCQFLDIDNEALLEYATHEEYSEPIKRIRAEIKANKVEFMHTAKNPAGVIFDMKNNEGWSDKREVDITSGGKAIDFSKPDNVTVEFSNYVNQFIMDESRRQAAAALEGPEDVQEIECENDED